MEGAGEKEMERDTETLPGCRSSATLDWSECVNVCVCVCTLCVYCGHWLWLPRLPVLLEMPAAVMCCDRG